MYTDEDVLVWQRNLNDWAESIHRKRLERAFLEAIRLLNEDTERLLHAFSRLGIWAAELAKANARGEVDEEEMRG